MFSTFLPECKNRQLFTNIPFLHGAEQRFADCWGVNRMTYIHVYSNKWSKKQTAYWTRASIISFFKWVEKHWVGETSGTVYLLAARRVCFPAVLEAKQGFWLLGLFLVLYSGGYPRSLLCSFVKIKTMYQERKGTNAVLYRLALCTYGWKRERTESD